MRVTRNVAMFIPAALLAASLASAAPVGMPNKVPAGTRAAIIDHSVTGASVKPGEVIVASVATPAPDANSVLILAPTVTGGLGSNEATRASALGYTVVVASNAAWSAMTTAEFASYRALILGDPTCVGGTLPIAAAEANKAVWGAALTGNVIVVGTDPTYHVSQGGAALTQGAIGFAAADPGKTGAYICLSCYYYDAAPGTPVPVLDPLGSFTVVGQGDCPARSHIIASHPSLAGITDATLSNWECSTHEGFVTWPASFDPLVISLDVPSPFVAPDGTSGAPYIMARGATLNSFICLTPDTATNEVGDPHTLCAFVNDQLDCGGTPQAGILLTFEAVAGSACPGVLGTATTDSSGTACLTYTCNTIGTDFLKVSYTDASGHPVSQTARKDWIARRNHEPNCSTAVALPATLWPPNHKYHAISISGVTDEDGDPVAITVTGITQDEPLNTRGDGNTCPDGQIVNGQASVRAERTGTPGIPGNGRVYTITFTADDGQGGSCEGSVSVCVPHDQGQGSTCIDDGQKYNSLGPCSGGSQLAQEVTEVGLTVEATEGAQAMLAFALPQEAPVELSVFDVTGRRLATVEKSVLEPGAYRRAWDMSGAPKGLYFVRLRAGAVTLTRTVVKIQ